MGNTTNQLRIGRAWVGVAAALLVAGCASYSGSGLKTGTSTAAEVRRIMGEPAKICPLADGGQNLIFPRGPAGLDTYNARIDGKGILRSVENVLDEDSFERVVRGKTTKNELLCIFGPPLQETYFSARNELVWDYRFMNVFGNPSRFHVLLDDSGVVTGTLQIEEDVKNDDRP